MGEECISLIICAYNQEHCVADAINSAFNQTYSPLEIIVSDDCSTDATFDVINKEVQKYAGRHRVWVNRNKVNIGIGRHWDYISRKAIGKLIVHCAGDDISLPNRVEEIVSAWTAIAPTPYLLSSNGVNMTRAGDDMEPVIDCAAYHSPVIQSGPRNFDFDILEVPVLGFALAVDKRLYDAFEEIKDPLWSEDEILRSRALLLGPIAFIPKVLIRYRDGGLSKGAQPSREQYLHRYRTQTYSRINYLKQLRDDFYSRGTPPEPFLRLTDKKLASAQRRLEMVDSSAFFYSLKMLTLQLLFSRNEGVTKSQYMNIFLVRWFPKLFFQARSLFRR